MMKRFAFLAIAGIVGWLANSSVATAGLIGPGAPGNSTTSVAVDDNPLTLTTPAAYGGALLNSIIDAPYSIIGGNSGTVSELVLGPDPTNPLGGLTFVLQAHVLTGDLTSVSNAIFGAGILTDVAQGPASLPLDASGTAQATQATRTGGGVLFSYLPGSVTSGSTLALIIRTNATSYDPNGQIGIHDGTTDNVSGFEPSLTPEPASVVLLGFGVAGMLGYGLKRRKVLA